MTNRLQPEIHSEIQPHHPEEMGAYFGAFFQLMSNSVAGQGSELGLGMTLFSLAVSIRAATIIEIGRFKGFSTLAAASALKFIDLGWKEPEFSKQRPDINYEVFEQQRERKLYSIEPFPREEAKSLIEKTNLSQYVHFIDKPSDEVIFKGQADLIFIDGDHSYKGCKRDFLHFIPANLRPGGYFILHDYFGWYDEQKRNNSPVKRVIDEIISEGIYQHILMDTGYMSFVIFRNPNPAIDS